MFYESGEASLRSSIRAVDQGDALWGVSATVSLVSEPLEPPSVPSSEVL